MWTMTAVETCRLPVSEGVDLAADVWAGGGPPFLLLHGLASNRRLWRGVAQHLAEAGHAVAALDLRGHGESDRPDGDYGFDAMASDVVATCRALGFDRPVVAGQSYGGNLVLEMADRKPGELRGVAAVDGGILDIAGRFRTWDECVAALSPPSIDSSLEQLRGYFLGQMSGWPEGSVEAAMACFEESSDGRARARLSLEHHLAILRSMWEHRPTELLSRVTTPVLLMPCDTGDAAWTAHKRETLSAVRRDDSLLRVRWFEAHHDVHLQRPADVGEELLAADRDGFFS